MRSAQALALAAFPYEVHVKQQLYVDDPAITGSGPEATVLITFDLTLVWWPILGLPIALVQGVPLPGNKEKRVNLGSSLR